MRGPRPSLRKTGAASGATRAGNAGVAAQLAPIVPPSRLSAGAETPQTAPALAIAVLAQAAATSWIFNDPNRSARFFMLKSIDKHGCHRHPWKSVLPIGSHE